MCASDLPMEEDHKHMVNDSSQMEKQSWLYFTEILHVKDTSVAIYADMYVEIGQTVFSAGKSEIQTKPQKL